MKETQKTQTTGGIGFCGCLAILFIALKLCDKIDWSWLWVLAPLWGPVALVLVAIVIVFIVEFIKTLFRR
jgi:hypothetical protein